jgi:hypothetical protein
MVVVGLWITLKGTVKGLPQLAEGQELGFYPDLIAI